MMTAALVTLVVAFFVAYVLLPLAHFGDSDRAVESLFQSIRWLFVGVIVFVVSGVVVVGETETRVLVLVLSISVLTLIEYYLRYAEEGLSLRELDFAVQGAIATFVAAAGVIWIVWGTLFALILGWIAAVGFLYVFECTDR